MNTFKGELAEIKNLITQQHLKKNFNHINQTLPASVILQIMPNIGIHEPTLFKHSTKLCFETSLDYLFHCQNVFDINLFPFSIQSTSDFSINIENKSDSFIWKKESPLTLYINLPNLHAINLLNNIYNNSLCILLGESYIKAKTKLINLDNSNISSHFEFASMFVNREENFYSIQISPEHDIKVPNNFTIEFKQSIPELDQKKAILFNCVPVINLDEIRSEPFMLRNNQEAHSIIADHYIPEEYLSPLNASQSNSQPEGTTSAISLEISSTVLMCHQNMLYKYIIPNTGKIYEKQNDQFTITTVNKWKAALHPIDYTLIEPNKLNEALGFNYLYSTNSIDQAELLKNFMTIHIRKESDVTQTTLENIDSIYLDPKPNNKLNYHIIFKKYDAFITLFIHILQKILTMHRPINLSIEVSYELKDNT